MTRKNNANNGNNSNRRARSGRRNRNRARDRGVAAPPRLVTNLPSQVNLVVPITRALRRVFTVDSTTIDGSAATTLQVTFAPGSTDWRISGASVYGDALPGLTDFTNLFDLWRLRKVTMRFDIAAGYSDSASTPVIMPNIYYVADYDDGADLTLTNMLQYPQVKVHSFYDGGYEPLQISLSPKPLRDVAGAGISTSYGPMEVAPWIGTGYTITPHYGLKFALDWMGKVQTADVQIVITVWYDMDFTNPK